MDRLLVVFMYLIYILVALYISLICHELGHTIMARIFKCKATKFSIGGLSNIVNIKIKGTEIMLNKIIDINPYTGILSYSNDSYCYIDDNDAKKLSKYEKIAIMLGGIMSNFLNSLISIVLYFNYKESFLLILGLINAYLVIRVFMMRNDDTNDIRLVINTLRSKA